MELDRAANGEDSISSGDSRRWWEFEIGRLSEHIEHSKMFWAKIEKLQDHSKNIANITN